MARFSAAWRTTGAGSTTLPIASLYATATVRPAIIEVGVFNTTTTGVAMALRRASSAGTQGAAQTEVAEDFPSLTAGANAVDTHSAGPTLTTGNLRAASLGAAVGSGVIWTFPRGLVVPEGTGNGVVIVPLTGTGQICDVYFSWEE